MQCHREKRAKVLASMARERPSQRTFGLLAVAALALFVHGASAAPPPLVPLDRNPTELLSRDWLQAGNVGAPRRRITTKSIFLVPERVDNKSPTARPCPEATWYSGGRCVPFLHLDEVAREQLLLDRLNVQFGTVASSGPSSGESYDYEETIPEAQGPLQVNIPFSPQLTGPTPPRAIPAEPTLNDKPVITSTNDAISTDSLENVKIQNSTKLQDNPTLIDQLESLKDDVADSNNRNPIESIVNMDGNIAIIDEYTVGASESLISTQNKVEEIKINNNKHTGNKQDSSWIPIVQEDTISENTGNSTRNSSSIHTSNKPDNTAEAQILPTEMTSEKSSYVKNKIRDKIKYDEHLQNKLRPELDYSDFSEAIKIISRFAEITTDDTFKQKNSSRDPYYSELNKNPLGTRTKLEHFKKLSRYNKPAISTYIEVDTPEKIEVNPPEQIELDPPEQIELDDKPLMQLNPNRAEYIKREIKDLWQVPHQHESHIQQNPSRGDQHEFSRQYNQQVVSQNPIRHRKLYQRPILQNVRRGKPGHGHATSPQPEDLRHILALARV